MLKIKEVIKEKGLTVKEVANRLGITRFGLSQQINGSPRLDTLQKIADVLDVDVLDLFEDKRVKKQTLQCPHCKKPIEIEIK